MDQVSSCVESEAIWDYGLLCFEIFEIVGDAKLLEVDFFVSQIKVFLEVSILGGRVQ